MTQQTSLFALQKLSITLSILAFSIDINLVANPLKKAPLSEAESTQAFHSCVIKKDDNACQKLINNSAQTIEECTKSTCNDMGLIYQNAGFQNKAIGYFKKAIDLGDTRSYHNLALLYKEMGNIPQAKKYYELAISKNQFGARLNLGTLYYEQKDFSNALKHFEIACTQGNAEAKMIACHNLAVMYDNGEGVKNDYQQAYKYYKIACDLNYGYACNNLGVLYANGYGTTQNLSKAIELYGKACKYACNKGCQNYKTMNR